MVEDFDKLTVPTSAFITFESDDAQIAAVNLETDYTLLGSKLKFEEASEPTDIIWENRRFTMEDYWKRNGIAYSTIAVMLVISGIIIYCISQYAAAVQNTFPPVNCDQLIDAYGDVLETAAIQDFNYIAQNKKATSSGCLQCYCNQQIEELGDVAKETTYADANNQAICGIYTSRYASAFYLASALSYIIIGFNYVLTQLCIAAIDWVGYKTETVRLSESTTVTWIVQYFNTGIILLLVNANMSDQPISFFLTGGAFSDFNEAWFKTVGNILVGSMMFNVYYPLIEAVGYWLMRIGFRLLDRGFSCDSRVTSSTSIQSYMEVVDGPLYFIHYKYSSVLTILYVTFMYGFGIPILFPIACASLIMLYFVEKSMLFYAYRMPPMYDERLSQNVLEKLQVAPILFCFFGYWMISNLQLISNEYLNAKESTSSPDDNEHSFLTVFMPIGWSGYKWPLLVTGIALTIILFADEWLIEKLTELIPGIEIGDIDLNETIGKYWESLDEDDRKWSKMEEENNVANLKLQILTDDQRAQLEGSEMVKTDKTLQGVHSYDILANTLYLDDFQYVTAAEGDNRADCIIDDDEDEGNDCA
jgi:hypothetical protein